MNTRKIAAILILIFSVFNAYSQFFNSSRIPEVLVEPGNIPMELDRGDSFAISATYTIPEHYHMFLNEELFNIYIDSDFVEQGNTVYPMEQSEELLGRQAFSGKVTISRNFILSDKVKSGPMNFTVSTAYQICEDDGTCLLPDHEDFSFTIDIGGNIDRSTDWRILISYILLALLGGVILNIMPCVLPLLSVKALNLVEQSHHDRTVIFRSSLLYGAGIWVSFLALAFSVILLKGSGELFGWGFQFQNPYFVLILATSIFIFSLSMFDVFTFNAPRSGMSRASKYSAGRNYSSSFFTGIFAVLVATPCTAPFMGAALGFAFSRSAPVILVIFSFLSFGFALPFIILGLFPALIQKIPKPGNWMNTFKEFMGFLLLGTMIYLLTTLYSLIGSSIKGVLWFLLFTGLAVWIFGKFGSVVSPLKQRIAAVILSLAIIVLSAAAFVDLSTVKDNSVQKADSFWKDFSTESVEKSRSEGKPVFIDFYADWCTSCKVNDAAVFNRQATQDLFRQFGVEMYKGDFTSGDEEIALWLSRYNTAGVPLYLLFRPGEDAYVFPEFLSYRMIEEELQKIRP